MFRLASSILALSVPVSATEACNDGVTCRQVSANDMTFDCAYAGESGKDGDVFLLHGNDGVTKERYFDLMRYLAGEGLRSVACDLRGYSPGASPQLYAAYNYNELAKDIFAIADLSGFDDFHVVAHDQGARLTWHAVAASAGRQRFRSIATLAIPHADAFSEALYGPKADKRQQTASQYVTVMTLNTTASTKAYCFGGSTDFCQRKFWWYNGAIDSGNMALAPKQSNLFFPHSNAAYGDDGVPQRTKAGKVDMPVLYACGTGDSADLCGREYAFAARSKELSNTDTYTYLELPSCGHDVAICKKTSDAFCDGAVCNNLGNADNKVFAAVLANIKSVGTVVV